MTDDVPAQRRIVVLTRFLSASSSLGTFGEIDTGVAKYPTLERPQDGEHPCIPIGEYDVDWTDAHPHHNPCYEIMRVPGRSAILFHAANWYQELLGCVAVATKREVVEGHLPDGTPIKQLGVSGSGAAVRAFVSDMRRDNFRLVIREA